MQISLKWINELVNIKCINLNKLIDKLTLGGFEVEDIMEVNIDKKKQIVLEISSTANRSDSLSIQGISTEIITLFNQKPKFSGYLTKSLIWKKKIKEKTKTILNKSDCSSFIALTVEHLNKISIPKWIKNKLISAGLTPTNTLLDFQNYILLETGYPLAIYDLEKIKSKLNASKFTLQIKHATMNTTFTGSNGINYTLDNSILIVKANHLPLSIAGILENQDFAYSQSTTSLLIEGSIFHAAKIRQQSRLLALRTDRSARYEKSLKNVFLIEAVYKFILLLRISNPELSCKFFTAASVSEQNLNPIFLHYKTVKEILGPIKENHNKKKIYISPELICLYLNRLNFKFKFDNINYIWEIQVSLLRSDDLTREIDIIEEIGRLHGFNNFLTVLPKIQSIGKEDRIYQTRKKIQSCLLNLGLNELIHYSLVNNKTFIKNEIQLINPLLTDYSNLRSSLLPNLISTIHENLKQSNLILEGFEYGHVFSGKIETTFFEIEKIAGIFGGNQKKSNWSEKSNVLSWFEAKGKIEKLFKQLNIKSNWKTNSSTNQILHPNRNTTVCLNNEIILGIFGQIHPLLAKKLLLPKEIYLFEFDMEQIEKQISKNLLIIYNGYSIYPRIMKDLSFVIKQDILFSEIQNTIYSNGTEFLSQIVLLDNYKGKLVPINHKSLCLQLIFQSKNKTLKNTDIDIIINNIKFILKQKFNVILRD